MFLAPGEAAKINLSLFTFLQFAPKASQTSQGKSAVKLCTLVQVHMASTRRNAGELKPLSLMLASGLFIIGKINSLISESIH